MTLRTLNYGNYGIFLIMGNAGFCPSTVVTFQSALTCGATLDTVFPISALSFLMVRRKEFTERLVDLL